MKIKSLFAVISILTFLIFISCNDDLNTIGGSIQPQTDLIETYPDTFTVSARTVSMFDSVYARTSYALLGKYEDEIFGTIKSDYLCQLYFPKTAKFSDTFKAIDSVKFVIDYTTFLGDTLAPMGLTVYKVTSSLPENFYTNIDPTKYSDMNQVLANEAYTISGSRVSGSTNRSIKTDLGVEFGQKIYDAWKSGKIHDDISFNDFFPGVYVTTNLGSGSLIQTLYSSVDIYYKQTYVDTLGVTRDTSAIFSLSATPEVLQLNHIKNTNPENLFDEGTGASYLKTPAGVFTEVVFPISKISANMEKQNMTAVNSAQFVLKGFTEREPDPTQFGMLTRPNYLLMIEKDSVETFFKKRQLPDGKTSILSSARNAQVNTYTFGNISSLIKVYSEKKVENATFYIIPVQTEFTDVQTSSQSYVSKLVGVYNYMVPSSAILRSDPSNMKLELVYSKF